MVNRMSTGFIWLSVETFRWHHFTSQSDVFRPWFWNSYTDSLFRIWTVKLLIITEYILLILANTVLLLCGQVTYIRPRQTSSVVLLISWWHWLGILRRIPTVKTACTLSLCRVSSNFMVYSETCDDLNIQVTYKFLSLTKFPVSLSRSQCLPLVTAVAFVTIMVLGLGLGLCLSDSTRYFCW